MLNMLIAIMGDTFGTNSEVEQLIQVKDHLSFVMDNWYLLNFRDCSDIKYIIAAFLVQDEDEDVEILHNIEAKVDSTSDYSRETKIRLCNQIGIKWPSLDAKTASLIFFCP